MRHMKTTIFGAAALALAGALLLPFTALAAASGPDDLEVVGGRFTNDTTPTIVWEAVTGAVDYEVVSNTGNWKSIGKVTQYTFGDLHDGWYTAAVRAKLRGGEYSQNTSITFEIDTEGPVMSRLSTDVNGRKATFNVSAKPDETYTGILECILHIEGVTSHVMHMGSGSTFTYPHAFTADGTYKARVQCTDTDENTTVTSWETVKIGAVTTPPEPTPASTGDRIKLACPAKPKAADPCHAVYYVADDGMRHLIPTEDVYKSWFSTWSGIKTVSASKMASYSLGENVTYRPGKTLIKFASDDAVYAIYKPNTLRHYVSAWLVKNDYGVSWPKYLRVLADTFRGQYEIGPEINEADDYDPDREWTRTDEIDDLFR